MDRTEHEHYTPAAWLGWHLRPPTCCLDRSQVCAHTAFTQCLRNVCAKTKNGMRPQTHAHGLCCCLQEHNRTQQEYRAAVETFLHSASQCIRQDPPDWTVSQQTVDIALPTHSGPDEDVTEHATLDVWRSCTGWRYPADDDSYMIKQVTAMS